MNHRGHLADISDGNTRYHKPHAKAHRATPSANATANVTTNSIDKNEAPADSQRNEKEQAELAFTLQRRIQYRTPKPWAGSITTMSAADRDNEAFTDGWENVAEDQVHVEIVPGTHRTILQRPNVETLASKLAAAIANASDS